MDVNLNNTDNNDYVRGYKDGKKAGIAAELQDDIKAIHANLRSWCFAKRTENERAEPHVPLFTCMDEAIISVLADMELRLRKIEAKTNE